MFFKIFFKSVLGLTLFSLISVRVNAQIKPDSTLGTENSIVTPNQTVKGVLSDVISGGTVRGTNLFHSFQDFNINQGQGAYFINPSGITNILTRITGHNSSSIFGVLGVLGNANLFFVNPNGIIFGPNARLNMNGSFLATTADSINLADGTVFSAKNPQSVPLLSVNIPIGLGFTGNPGSIQVQGTGHNLVQTGDPSLPVVPLNGSILTGLTLQPEHTLALVGGDITFTGGIVTAPSGRIEIASVASGQVNITPKPSEDFSLSYEKVQSFQNILLARQALLNASGSKNGNIQIFGKKVDFIDNSLAFIENQGFNSLGAISVNASESFTISGDSEFTTILANPSSISSGLDTQTFNGKGADINISTKHLVLQNSGGIYLSTFGSGAGGNLSIKADDSVQILGTSPFNPSFPVGSLVATATSRTGDAGNILLTTKELSIRDGGGLESVVFGDGKGGDVTVNASKDFTLTGFSPSSFIPSLVSSITSSSGNAGKLLINTKQLTLQDGGRVDSSTLASGAAGSVTINASDSIKVTGIIPGSVNPSLIISSDNVVDQNISQGLNLPLVSTGASGNININTSMLRVTNGAQITVRNDGTEDAGKLQINARFINLDNQGGITASAATGKGGNIFLRSGDLQLRRGSTITATAGNRGDGGNITINTATIAALENSSITANAFEGRGGNVKINTQGLFLSRNSQITASSQKGIDGVVQINVPDPNLARAAAQVPVEVDIPNIAVICAGDSGEAAKAAEGEFVNIGTGGIPFSPFDPIGPSIGWIDNYPPAPEVSSKLIQTKPVEKYTEAQGWAWNPDGTVRLTAEPTPEVVPYGSLSSPPCNKMVQPRRQLNRSFLPPLNQRFRWREG